MKKTFCDTLYMYSLHKSFTYTEHCSTACTLYIHVHMCIIYRTLYHANALYMYSLHKSFTYMYTDYRTLYHSIYSTHVIYMYIHNIQNIVTCYIHVHACTLYYCVDVLLVAHPDCSAKNIHQHKIRDACFLH